MTKYLEDEWKVFIVVRIGNRVVATQLGRPINPPDPTSPIEPTDLRLLF